MAEQPFSLEALARPIIVQCRCEIEAARIHIEAGKEILRRSRWLMARWESQRSDEGAATAIRLPPFDVVKAGMLAFADTRRDHRNRRAV